MPIGWPICTLTITLPYPCCSPRRCRPPLWSARRSITREHIRERPPRPGEVADNAGQRHRRRPRSQNTNASDIVPVVSDGGALCQLVGHPPWTCGAGHKRAAPQEDMASNGGHRTGPACGKHRKEGCSWRRCGLHGARIGRTSPTRARCNRQCVQRGRPRQDRGHVDQSTVSRAIPHSHDGTAA